MRHKKPKEKEDLGNDNTSNMPILKYDNTVIDEDHISHIDQGVCLSMHQPYASLLVAGVKRFAYTMNNFNTWQVAYFLGMKEELGQLHIEAVYG